MSKQSASELEAELVKERRESERHAVTEALRRAGHDGPLARGAAALLIDEGRIGRDDEGRIVFKRPTSSGTVDTDLRAGVADWARGEDGAGLLKRAAPARGGERRDPTGRFLGGDERADAAQAFADAVLGNWPANGWGL